jgi:hypothetical protein
MIDWSDTANNFVVVTYPTVGKGTGNLVKVRIQYKMTLLTPIISTIVGGNSLLLNAEATQVIVKE